MHENIAAEPEDPDKILITKESHEWNSARVDRLRDLVAAEADSAFRSLHRAARAS